LYSPTFDTKPPPDVVAAAAGSHLSIPAVPAHAAICARISSDPAGAGLGVARQADDCHALCERLGWPVAQVHRDNDVSAYSGRPRPQWRQPLADIDSRLVDAIVCWHVDRLTRSARELRWLGSAWLRRPSTTPAAPRIVASAVTT
jgi:hypothetical protein